MNIAVLGATGYIGSRVVQRWAGGEGPSAGTCLAVFSLAPREEYGPLLSGVEGVALDVSDAASWERFRDVDVIVHAAGPSRVRAEADKNHALDVHYSAAKHLGTWLRARGGRRAIYLSTMHVYGANNTHVWHEYDPAMPPHLYAKLKLAGEQAIGVGTNPDAIALRLAHVYGVGAGTRLDPNGIVHRSVMSALGNQAVGVDGDGSQMWDFVHVDDVARAIDLCLDAPGVSGVYNIGTGPLPIAALIGEIGKHVVPITHKRVKLESRKVHTYSCVMNSSKARLDFGWHSRITLTDGIKELIEHFRVDTHVNIKTIVADQS